MQVGRITADEFDQRSGQVLAARTGKELTVPLADLPVDRAPAARGTAVAGPQRVRATALERPQRASASRVVIGASAAYFGVVAVVNALSSGPTLAQREFFQEMAARQGLSIPVPPASGFNLAGTVVPGVIAVLLVMLIIFLRVTRTDRP